MYGVHIKNCDRKSVLYVPFEISFYSMVSVAVTFLSRLSVFPRKLECFCALFIARIFLKLKKKKTNHFHQWRSCRTPTEVIKNLL